MQKLPKSLLNPFGNQKQQTKTQTAIGKKALEPPEASLAKIELFLPVPTTFLVCETRGRAFTYGTWLISVQLLQ